MSAHPPVAVFDLDGTLADTAPDLIGTLNHIMDLEGLPHVPVESARELLGAGARALIERGLTNAQREVTPERLDRLFVQFLAHYGEHLCDKTELFPGVTEVLDGLEAEGYALAVCTNKVAGHSVELLEKLGIAHRFKAICGRDSFAYFKPDPRHLTLTIEAAGGRSEGSVMVGDSITDIATAKAAGLPVVAVSFGYTQTPVRELGPDIVVDHYDEMLAAIRSVTGGSDRNGGRDRD